VLKPGNYNALALTLAACNHWAKKLGFRVLFEAKKHTQATHKHERDKVTAMAMRST